MSFVLWLLGVATGAALLCVKLTPDPDRQLFVFFLATAIIASIAAAVEVNLK